MPLYQRLSREKNLSLCGYEQVFQPEQNEWQFTHRLADTYNIQNRVYTTSRGKVRYHIDFNKLNNNPENIHRCHWSEHHHAHQKHPEGNPQYADTVMTLHPTNHQVVAIIDDDAVEDVYDFTVDDYHNFAIENGIFVHNSHKKIRNAVMELIQFKSINGKKFENLKIIWAAINPDDEDRYDVEKIDDAQIDRFHIYVSVPYKCNRDFFVRKYGAEQGKAAIQWWNSLANDQKELISPRRLDYALMVGREQGDLRDVLPRSSNISKLIISLQLGPIDQIVKKIMEKGDIDEARRFITVDNNWDAAIQYIVKKTDRMKFFLPFAPPEKLAALLSKNTKVLSFILENSTKYDTFTRVSEDVHKGTKNKKLKSMIIDLCRSIPVNELPETMKYLSNTTTGVMQTKYGNRWKKNRTPWLEQVEMLRMRIMNNTYERKNTLVEIDRFLPPTLSIKEAIKTLKLLNQIAHHSYPSTIKRMKSFIPLANHCCAEITRHSPGNIQEDLSIKYKYETLYIRRKLRLAGKIEQFAFSRL